MKRSFGIAIVFSMLLMIVAAACASATPASSPTETPPPGNSQTPTPVQPTPTPGQIGTTEVPAPIEDVRIDLPDAGSKKGTLVVTSGLPNSCYSFSRHVIERNGDSYDVQIINSQMISIGGEPIACAEVYGTVETEIALEGDIVACKVYDVTVNGEKYSVQAIAPNVRCMQPGEDKMIPVPAPIDNVEINIAESFPPQYFVHIVSGLPNGCARFNELTTTRDGNTITIKVTNLMPADPNVVCTQIYGQVEHNINLGADFKAGETYTVKVNDVTKTFVGQGNGQSNVELGKMFELGFGSEAVIMPDGLVIKFVRVTEDSRCPADAICIWAGQAKIMVEMSRNGESLGQHELLLEDGVASPAGARINDYVVKFLALNPYPGTTGNREIKDSEYFASLVVTKLDAGTPNVVNAELGERFNLRVGQPAMISPDGLQVRFLDVIEESRCPIGVNCIVEGRAVIQVEVTLDGENLGKHDVEIGFGAAEAKVTEVSDFLIAFAALNPHPVIDVQIEKEAYVATMVVTKGLP